MNFGSISDLSQIFHIQIYHLFFCRFNCRHFHLDGVFTLSWIYCTPNAYRTVLICVYLYLCLLTIMKVFYFIYKTISCVWGSNKNLMTDRLITTKSVHFHVEFNQIESIFHIVVFTSVHIIKFKIYTIYRSLQILWFPPVCVFVHSIFYLFFRLKT